MKKSLIFTLILITAFFSFAQNNQNCASITYKNQPYLEHDTKYQNKTLKQGSGNSEIIVDKALSKIHAIFDSYGNRYAFENISITKKSENREIFPTCDSGYFTLHFTTGSGMESSVDPVHQERRDVVCQVFSDISNMISSPLTTSGNTINIWVRDLSQMIDSPNALGAATSFYVIPSDLPLSGGIADNEIWKTIHTGVDSYTNTFVPLSTTGLDTFYHGMMGFNFNNSILWNTDLSVDASPGFFDLYTVVLHEVTHALGFSSLISFDGSSEINLITNYYNRYDSLLLNSNDNNLITSSDACSSMYDYTYTANQNDLTPNCSLTPPINESASVDHTFNCNTAITFNGLNTVQVYNPGCFENGSSLSHFEDECFINPATGIPYGNNNYFVMSNLLSDGVTKRELKPEELQTLCDIGYSINDLTTCNGLQVAGVNDGIESGTYTFIGDAGTPIDLMNDINGNSILTNDTNATSFECIEDVYDPSATIIGSEFNSSVPGLHLLRYVPINGNQRGNITYIYVLVNSNCGIAEPCNLVINGDFEQYSEIPDNGNQIDKACNWQSANFSGSPDYCHRFSPGANNGVPINVWDTQEVNVTYGGDAYVAQWASGNTREIIRTKLASPLTENTTYLLSFDVALTSSTIGGSFFEPFRYQANFTSSSTISESATYNYPFESNDILLINEDISDQLNIWETITFEFTTGDMAGQTFLDLGYLTDITGDTPARAVYFIDNVFLKEVDTTSLNLPDTICLDETITNLNLFLEPPVPGGTYTGPGVTGNTFDASIAGLGTHTITYTSSTGCQDIISDTINVVNTDCIDDCPNCEEIIEQIFIQQERGCGTYTAFVPSSVNNCYRVDYFIDGVLQGQLADGGTFINFTSNGSYELAIAVVDITVSPEVTCAKKSQKIDIDCFSDCPDCSSVFEDIISSIEPTLNCGEFLIKVPKGVEDCYKIILIHEDNELSLDEGITTFNYTENGAYTIHLSVIDLETGNKCAKKKMNLTVDCFDNCPDCSEVYNHTVETIQQTENCGEFEINVPQGLSECYKIILTHEGVDLTLDEGVTQFNYDENGSYLITITIVDLNSETKCIVKDINLTVDCFCSGDNQKINDTWVFGQNKWNFDNSASNGFTNTQINHYMKYASASVSDRYTGNLLFYTDGMTVYNNTGNVMSGGNELFGDPSSDSVLEEFYTNAAFCDGIGLGQNTLILPKPGTENIYFVFSISYVDPNYNDCIDGIYYGQDFNYGLRYAEIDMSANGGLGTVVSKNNIISNAISTGLTSTLAEYNDSYWLLTSTEGDLYAYKVDETGIQIDNPVITSTTEYLWGSLKVSPDWSLLYNNYYLYDFDNSTGTISNPNYILSGLSTSEEFAYKNSAVSISLAEFSADSNILYFISAMPNLCTSCDALFVASGLSMYNTQTLEIRGLASIDEYEFPLLNPNLYTANIQRASNDKIYLIFNNQEHQGINNDFVETSFGWSEFSAPYTYHSYEWGVIENINYWSSTTHPVSSIIAPLGVKNGYVFPQLIPSLSCANSAPPRAASYINEGDDNQNKLLVYPNPAKDKVIINLNDSSERITSLTIRTLKGQTVYQSNTTGEVNITKLNSGLYFIELKTVEGKIYLKRLIIE